MKNLILAVAVLMSLGAGSAMAQSYAHEAPPSGSYTQSNNH